MFVGQARREKARRESLAPRSALTHNPVRHAPSSANTTPSSADKTNNGAGSADVYLHPPISINHSSDKTQSNTTSPSVSPSSSVSTSPSGSPRNDESKGGSGIARSSDVPKKRHRNSFSSYLNYGLITALGSTLEDDLAPYYIADFIIKVIAQRLWLQTFLLEQYSLRGEQARKTFCRAILGIYPRPKDALPLIRQAITAEVAATGKSLGLTT